LAARRQGAAVADPFDVWLAGPSEAFGTTSG
jgi:hypothetical protein